MTVILKYNEYDGTKVIRTLAKKRVEIIKIYELYGSRKVKIKINNLDELNDILYDINYSTAYEVIPISIKKESFLKSFFKHRKDIFEEF